MFLLYRKETGLILSVCTDSKTPGWADDDECGVAEARQARAGWKYNPESGEVTEPTPEDYLHFNQGEADARQRRLARSAVKRFSQTDDQCRFGLACLKAGWENNQRVAGGQPPMSWEDLLARAKQIAGDTTLL